MVLKKAAAAGDDGEKPKRKRIIKATTSNSTEEAVVEDTSVPAIEAAAEEPKKHLALKKGAPKKEAPIKEASQKRGRKKQEDEQPTVENNDVVTTAKNASTDGNKADEQSTSTSEINIEIPERGSQVTKFFPQRREQAFNIEFDGIIMAEGVLEMMPDGYGFLRSSTIPLIFGPK